MHVFTDPISFRIFVAALIFALVGLIFLRDRICRHDAKASAVLGSQGDRGGVRTRPWRSSWARSSSALR